MVVWVGVTTRLGKGREKIRNGREEKERTGKGEQKEGKRGRVEQRREGRDRIVKKTVNRKDSKEEN